jgi:gluconolactonase
MADAGSDPEPPAYPMLEADQIGEPQEVAKGFRLAESPVWNPCTNSLLFADVMGAGGKGVIHSLDSAGMVTDFMTDTGNTNGFAYDIDGSLILTQMTGHLARRDKSGVVMTLEPAGVRLHTPDDVVVRSDGTIYFSDGDFCPVGNLLGYRTSLPVFMLKPGATSLVNVGMVGGPNGIRLSPDEKTLYVDGFGAGTISAFDVADDGTATKRSAQFASGLSNPDSMCLDAAGNLYVGVSSGLQVFRPNGEKVKLVRVDVSAGECTISGVTNCGFGGEDGKTLYITTWKTVVKIGNMPIPGLDWKIGKQRAVCN